MKHEEEGIQCAVVELDIPEKLSTNLIYAGRHWAKRKADADLYHWAVFAAVRKQKPFFPQPCKLYFLFEFKNDILDCSNCSYMAKLCEDGLVHAGALTDDSTKYVSRVALDSIKGDRDRIIISAV